MDDADTRRLRNARWLAAKVGGQSKFAARIERDVSFVSQLIGKNPKRSIGNETAKVIEQSFGLPHGWLDQDFQGLSVAAQQMAEAFDSMSPEQKAALEPLIAAALGYKLADRRPEHYTPITPNDVNLDDDLPRVPRKGTTDDFED